MDISYSYVKLLHTKALNNLREIINEGNWFSEFRFAADDRALRLHEWGYSSRSLAVKGILISCLFWKALRNMRYSHDSGAIILCHGKRMLNVLTNVTASLESTHSSTVKLSVNASALASPEVHESMQQQYNEFKEQLISSGNVLKEEIDASKIHIVYKASSRSSSFVFSHPDKTITPARVQVSIVFI